MVSKVAFVVLTSWIAMAMALRKNVKQRENDVIGNLGETLDAVEKCKGKSKSKDVARVCEAFYDSSVGVGVSMIGDWRGLAFPQRQKAPQSVSITHSEKGMCFFEGTGGNQGMLLNVGPQTKFWKRFQVCENRNDMFAAKCTDGFQCSEEHRATIESKDWTYEKFLAEKNAVVNQTATANCPVSHERAYNEFNTHGFPKDAVAGVIIPECLSKVPTLEKPPTASVVFGLRGINLFKRWPVFTYKNSGSTSTLTFKKYM